MKLWVTGYGMNDIYVVRMCYDWLCDRMQYDWLIWVMNSSFAAGLMCMWHDTYSYVTGYVMTDNATGCSMIGLQGLWILHLRQDSFVCDMTRLFICDSMQYDWVVSDTTCSFAIGLIYMWHDLLIHMWQDVIWLLYVWYDRSMCDRIHLYMTWLHHPYEAGHNLSYVYAIWLVNLRQDSFIYDRRLALSFKWTGCNMTHLYVTWFIHVTRLFYMWLDWFTCGRADSYVILLTYSYETGCNMPRVYIPWLIHLQQY